MSRSWKQFAAVACVVGSSTASLGCSDDDSPSAGGTSGTAGSGGSGGTGGSTSSPASFQVRIENVSDGSPLRTPVSPGVWVLHMSPGALFIPGQPDPGVGLEALAEDGSPAEIASSLSARSGVAAGSYDTAIGTETPAAAQPGQSFEFSISARPGQRLSFASMFAESNDVLIASPDAGIELFDGDGVPHAARDVTGALALWDAGTEKDEAPGFGLAQAPRQPSPDYGSREGVVSRRTDPTRALPSPAAIADVRVTESGGVYTIEVRNVSITRGVAKTPLSPIFYALLPAGERLFEPGDPASPGLEALAEDGNARPLVEQTIDGRAGSVGTAPFVDGQSLSFSVAPTPELPALGFATMFGDSNDVFLATDPDGVPLMDAEATLRPASDVAAEIGATLALWDAGTEANEVPGVGANQAPRQPAPNTGPADPMPMVRRYLDSTNDLEASLQARFVTLEIVHSSGTSFVVTITNSSAGTPFPGIISPVAWMVTDGNPRFFQVDAPASIGLQRLAEDGEAPALIAEVTGEPGIGSHGVAGSAPVPPGSTVSFTVTASMTHRYLHVASMLVPSNDSFFAFPGQGIELVTSTGEVRSNGEVAADVEELLYAWDAGTEWNQASALGPHMAGPGLQMAPNTGRAEGDGTLRLAETGLWPFPAVAEIVRVTITPGAD